MATDAIQYNKTKGPNVGPESKLYGGPESKLYAGPGAEFKLYVGGTLQRICTGPYI